MKKFVSEKSAVEFKLLEILELIKSKTMVSVGDLEEFATVANYIALKIEELRKSRDNWRNKYEELRAALK